MYVIIITVVATGTRKLYPVIYDTWQEATYDIERLPYSRLV